MQAKDNPSTPSLAHEKLSHHWETVRTVRKGAEAIRKAGERFLIKFPAEDADEYARRLKSAPWRPEFNDCIATLAAKPFTKQVVLAEGASERMQGLAEDIDGRGNNLHVFAKDAFEGAVAMGAHGILVDYPQGNQARNRAEELAAGVRPYWVPINADDIIELGTEQRGSRRVVSLLRVKESRVVRDGFQQTVIPLIREIRSEPSENSYLTSWTVWREEANAGTDKPEWVKDSSGEMTLDEVPFVFFATNDVEGEQYVKPPLIDVADMQVELYNAMSKKELSYTITAHPMLTANGMAPPADGKIETGPGRVLYAPGAEGINASWDYLHPNAANLKEIREDIREIIEDIRRLGMQPMTQPAGNTPAIAYAFDGQKSVTVLQSWALALKDALEQAFVFTAAWLNEPTESAPSVMVNTDFVVGLYGGTEITELNKARIEGQISRETYWSEMQRRGFLGPQFDPEDEATRLDAEFPPFDPSNSLNDASDDDATN